MLDAPLICCVGGCRVALKQTEEDALEECLLVMQPCDPAAPDDADECLDEEVCASHVL